MNKPFANFALWADRIYFITSAVVAGFLAFEIIARFLTERCCGEYFSPHGIGLVFGWMVYSVIVFGPLLLLFYFFFQLVQCIRYRRWGRFGISFGAFIVVMVGWFATAGPLIATFLIVSWITGETPRLL